MVTPGDMAVEKDAMQRRRAFKPNARLLPELACEGVFACLARLHASAGKVPPRDIAVPHQKDRFIGRDDDPTHAKRHRAPEEKNQVREPGGQPVAQRSRHP